MIRVFATREGLLGKASASGWRISEHVPFVALPTRAALYEKVRVRNPKNGKEVIARVLDVGPWNTTDDVYVYGGARPQAETGTDKLGRKTNGAGIDLGEKVWRDLQMKDNGDVEWEFV